MSTKILTFNPLAESEVAEVENELDGLLSSGWEIITSIGGNRSGRQGGRGHLRSEREVAAAAPESKDYIVLILHKGVEKTANGNLGASETSRLFERRRNGTRR